jgi:hypothetical protein
MPFLRNKNGKDLYGPKITTLGGDGSFNITVGTSETNLASLIIPGNTFGGRSCIKIKTRIYKTSTNAQTILTLRLGTGGTVSDTLIGSYTATSSSHQIIPMERTFCTQTTTIATIVGVLPEDVSVKATTTEKMGFVGREEGLVAYANVLLRKVE